MEVPAAGSERSVDSVGAVVVGVLAVVQVVSVSEGSGGLSSDATEVVDDLLTGGVHVGEGTWGKSESVVGSEESSHEGLTLGSVDLAGSVVVVLVPEVLEVGSDVGVNLVVVHHVESSDDVGSPLGSGGLWQLVDSGSSTHWVSLFDLVSLEDVIHDIVLISSIALG